MRSPVLICGCPGSGTSFITKMLRYAGMFAGADAGPMKARKFHESQCLVDCNKQFLMHTIDFPFAPKGAWQFSEHIRQAREQINQLVDLVDKKKLLETFWGGQRQQTDIWGWKDPRNSATAVIWRKIFPEQRLLIVSRKWNKTMRLQAGGSLAAKWFRLESTAELRDLYVNPPGVDGLDSYQVDFDNLTTDAEAFRGLLQWIGLPDLPASRYTAFLEQVGIDKR